MRFGRVGLAAVALASFAVGPSQSAWRPSPKPVEFWPPPVLSLERAVAETVRVDSRGGGAFDTGTGVAVGAHVVLTNAHLTRNPITVVTRCGDQVLPVERIEYAANGVDVAAVVTGGPGLLPVPLAARDPDAVDRVLAVGYPQGQLSVVDATIEGTLRQPEGLALRFRPYPQVGQSGSPLLATDGRLAALAFARDTVGEQGLAIPASTLKTILDDFRARDIPIADSVTGDPIAIAARSSICP